MRRAPRSGASFVLASMLSTAGLFVGGPLVGDAAAQNAADPAVDGLWEGPFNWPVISVHSALLPDGRVLQFSYNVGGPAGSLCYVFDPKDFSFKKYIIGVELFCAGHAMLPDGRILANGNINTEKLTHTFDVVNGWVRQPDMTTGRFYPTTLTLPTGNIWTHAEINNNYNEVFRDGIGWHKQNGTSLSLGSYPRSYVMPDGDIVVVGSMRPTYVFDRTNETWSHITDSAVDRFEGTSVQLPPNPGRYLVMGGYNSGSNTNKTAEILDMTGSTPAWRNTADMRRKRHHLNSTLLPDGTVLVTGGGKFARFGEDPVYEAELFDPVAETWTLLAPMTDPRLYHSTAILLPDGRVLSSGGEGWSTADIFRPPYLFKGPRPTLHGVPGDATYRSSIVVGSDQALNIDRVALIGPGSVTHAWDMGQRYLTLPFELKPTNDGKVRLEIRMPDNPNLAPPMYYMLFLVNKEGVPSMARMIQVH